MVNNPAQLLEKIQFLSGAGNKFLIAAMGLAPEKNKALNELNNKTLAAELSDLAIQLCNSDAKSDGLLVLQLENNKWNWYFYNRDGSSAEFCGNAARCAAVYLLGLTGVTTAQHKTLTGLVSTEVINTKNFNETIIIQNGKFNSSHVKLSQEKYLIRVTYKVPGQQKLGLSLNIDDNQILGDYINSGVPHFVSWSNEVILDNELKKLGNKIRNHKSFSPKGTNASFCSLLKSADDGTGNFVEIKAVSYERGVEDFTPACGTGAVASALSCLARFGVTKTLVHMPGGNILVTCRDHTEIEMLGTADYC